SHRPLPAPHQVYFLHPPAPSRTCPLSLHDALPISANTPHDARAPSATTSSGASPACARIASASRCGSIARASPRSRDATVASSRSEEHTSELQSREKLVCRLLLEKK